MSHAFWQGKRVLLTGHTGFKGGWLALWLQKLGAQVIGYALPPPTATNLFTVANVASGMVSIIGDVRDYAQMQSAFADHRPEIVFHMAAQPLVRYSYAQPVETYATNVMGTVHLLEAARQTGNVRAIVNVTSDKCYENKEWEWGYRENEPLGGYDPYSNSKGCAELVTTAYRNSYFNPNDYAQHSVALASGRAGNVIGGGDWAQDRLIPDIIQACLQNRQLKIRNPHATRPWQHVLEPLQGYLTLAERLYTEGTKFAEAWNFGPRESDVKPVNWIVHHVSQLLGLAQPWELETPRYHEAAYLKLDCSKAHARLGWKPRLQLEQALQKTVDWYRAHYDRQDMRAVTLAQIGHYESLLV